MFTFVPAEGYAPAAGELRFDMFPLVARDDHDTIDRAAFLYDALYAALGARAP